MRCLWVMLAVFVAVGFIAFARDLSPALAQPFSGVMEGDPNYDFENDRLPGIGRAPSEQSNRDAIWDDTLRRLMRASANGTITREADRAIALFAALDRMAGYGQPIRHTLLSDQRFLLELRLGIVDALIAAGARDKASALAVDPSGRLNLPVDSPDIQAIIPLLTALAERRLALGQRYAAIMAADAVWRLQLQLLGADHPDLDRLWAERQAFAVRAGSSAQELASAESSVGPRSREMSEARRARADAALQAGNIRVALGLYERVYCTDSCSNVLRYAAGITLYDPQRVAGFVAAVSARVPSHERRVLAWIVILADAYQRPDGSTFLRQTMAARAQDAETRIKEASDKAGTDQFNRLRAVIRAREAEIGDLLLALSEIEMAMERVLNPNIRAERRPLYRLFVTEARRIGSAFRTAQQRDREELERHPDYAPPVESPMAPPAAPEPRGPSGPVAAVPPDAAPTVKVDVHYATSRRRGLGGATAENWRTAEKFYTSTPSADIAYGKTVVSIPRPRDRKPGDFPVPAGFYDRDWTGALVYDEKSHVTLLRIAPMTREAFLADLRAQPNDSAIVFVHGFNVTFADAARRAGQLKYDLGIQGPAVMYSWPAGMGSFLAYYKEGEHMAAEIRSGRFARFLTDLRETLGAGRVTVIAHSMGSRLLAATLTKLAAENPPEAAKFNGVVFAAADVESGAFARQAPAWTKVARGVTLYASYNDLAMKASQVANPTESARAGYTGTIALAEGLISVDASAAEDEFSDRHSYFADGLLPDIKSILRFRLTPRQRCVLSPAAQQSGRAMWRFDEQNCRLGAFRTAVDLATGAGTPAQALARIDGEVSNPSSYRKALVSVQRALRAMVVP